MVARTRPFFSLARPPRYGIIPRPASRWSGDMTRANALHELLWRLREDIPATPWRGVGEPQSYADNFTFTSEKGDVLAASAPEYVALGDRISQTLRASAAVADLADAFIDGVSGSGSGSGSGAGGGGSAVRSQRCDMRLLQEALVNCTRAGAGVCDELSVEVYWCASLLLAPAGTDGRVQLEAVSLLKLGYSVEETTWRVAEHQLTNLTANGRPIGGLSTTLANIRSAALPPPPPSYDDTASPSLPPPQPSTGPQSTGDGARPPPSPLDFLGDLQSAVTRSLDAGLALAASQAPSPTELPPRATLEVVRVAGAATTNTSLQFPPVGTDEWAHFKARYDASVSFGDHVPYTLQAGGRSLTLQRYVSEDVELIGLGGETVVAGRDEYLAVFEGIKSLRRRFLDTGLSGEDAPSRPTPLFQLMDASSSSSSPMDTAALTVASLPLVGVGAGLDDDATDIFRLGYRWIYCGALRLPSQRDAASQALGGQTILPPPIQQLLLSSSSSSSTEVKFNVTGIFRYTFQVVPTPDTGGYAATLRRHSVDEMTVNGFELESSALASIVKNSIASTQQAGGGGTIQELAGLAAWLISKSDRGTNEKYRPFTAVSPATPQSGDLPRTRGDAVLSFLSALHRDLPYLAVRLTTQEFLRPDVVLRGQLLEPLAQNKQSYDRLLGGLTSTSRRLLEEGLLAPLNGGDANEVNGRNGVAAAAAAAASATTYTIEYTREGHVRVPWRLDLEIVTPWTRLPLCIDAVSLFLLAADADGGQRSSGDIASSSFSSSSVGDDEGNGEAGLTPLVREHRLLEVSLNGQPSLAKVVEWVSKTPQQRRGKTSSVQVLKFLTRIAGGDRR